MTSNARPGTRILGSLRSADGAGVVRIKGTDRGLAMSVDGNGRYCYLDPKRGAMLAVAEAARNVACAGALPVAATNCLNFGNPERPPIMWQFARAVEGIAEACRALNERRENCHALLERIERSFRAFAQLASRSIGVDADHQRRAETACMIKIGDVTSMKNVEHAIGEHQRTGQRRNSRGQVVPRGQLDSERGRRKTRQLMYSNTLTTRWTPLVVRAISAAAFPSTGRTMPRR